ncbi:MAG: hypothetical protein AB1921_13520 [Thermodesulfobacteriota bacterium]
MDLEKARKQHMRSIGITGKEALKEHIEGVFAAAKSQEDAPVGIYRMVLPDWDRIERVHGYPEAGEALWQFICQQFMDFDKAHHPDVLAGGAWMNTGFSVNREIDPWQISMAKCAVDLSPEGKEHQNASAQDAERAGV